MFDGKAIYGEFEDTRLFHTYKFIGDISNIDVLDIGHPNEFSHRLAMMYDNIRVVNTAGDLNSVMWETLFGGKFNMIWCFHVIEHLLNPLLFLQLLKGYCHKDTRIIITYPVGKYQYDCHWYQIPRKKFIQLVNMAGYEIVKYKRVFPWRNWRYIFFKVRPFLRFVIFGQRHEYYELRIKKAKD